jgi:tetratricopeptide (TPR) repeat protein
LFRRLTVFAGGCTLEAVEWVCETSWTEIASLVEKGLLQLEPAVGGAAAGPDPRVRLLETVREYGVEQLEASGEAVSIRRRHVSYYVGLAEEAEPRLLGPEQDTWLRRLYVERDNFRAATRRAMEGGDAESVLRLNAALPRFWYARGAPADARDRIQDLLTLAPAAPPRPSVVKAFAGVGDLARIVGDYAAAQALFEQSLAVARRLGYRLGTAAALRRLAQLAGYRGSYLEADRLGRQSLAILERCDDPAELAGTLRELGMISYLADDQARARELLERSLATARRVGNEVRIGDASFSLALTYHVSGELDLAWRLYEDALRIDRARGNRGAEGSVLNNLGSLAILRRDLDQARVLLRRSLLASRDGGDRRRLAFTLSAVAGLIALEGESEGALRLDAAGRAALDALGARLASAMRALRRAARARPRRARRRRRDGGRGVRPGPVARSGGRAGAGLAERGARGRRRHAAGGAGRWSFRHR